MSRGISLDLRLRTISLYGDETWSLVEALQMWIFRRLARVNYKDRMTDEEGLKRLGVQRGLLS